MSITANWCDGKVTSLSAVSSSCVDNWLISWNLKMIRMRFY
jgi:hypothetical protein